MRHANTDHDEATIREAWTGESWLGEESMRAPKHGAPRTEWTGTFPTDVPRGPKGQKELHR